jgi:hypothetical protein
MKRFEDSFKIASLCFALMILIALVSCKTNQVVEPVSKFTLDGFWQSYKDASLENYPFWQMTLHIEGRDGRGQFTDQLYQYETDKLIYTDNEQQNVSFELVFNFFGVGEVRGQFYGNIKIVNGQSELHGHIAIDPLKVYGVVHLKRQGQIYLPKKGHDQGSLNNNY